MPTWTVPGPYVVDEVLPSADMNKICDDLTLLANSTQVAHVQEGFLGNPVPSLGSPVWRKCGGPLFGLTPSSGVASGLYFSVPEDWIDVWDAHVTVIAGPGSNVLANIENITVPSGKVQFDLGFVACQTGLPFSSSISVFVKLEGWVAS